LRSRSTGRKFKTAAGSAMSQTNTLAKFSKNTWRNKEV
jgi:hypothetical protein